MINFTVMGDIFPANLPYHQGFGIASKFNHHDGEPWKYSIRKITENSDFVFCNLESPLFQSDNYEPKETDFCGYPQFASYLDIMGVNIVSICNNHIFEKGTDGYAHTLRYLSKYKIDIIGVNRKFLPLIKILEKDNTRIGITAFNAIDNIDENTLISKYDKNVILQTIERMKTLNLDYKILSFHWGDEYLNYPSVNQIKDAHEFIDSGADIIVGHHPHAIQPIEEYKNGIIIYSLGNFLFDMLWSKNVRTGLVVKLELDAKRSIQYSYSTIFINNAYTPLIVSNKKISRINQRFNRILSTNFFNNEKIFHSIYNQIKILTRYYYRVLMKLYLLRNWKKLTKRTKRELFGVFFKFF
jgi:gamma-polyglutamate biosynthesis protein CapA